MFKKTGYKTESFITDDILSEYKIGNYYKDNGYIVYSSTCAGFKKYPNKIKKNSFDLNENTRNLFNTYTSGYPDFMLIKDNVISFVEIKRDNDSLRKNQVEFLEELSNYSEVTVVYVNTYNPVLAKPIITNNLGKEIRSVCREYEKIRKKKAYKQNWVIAKLYDRYLEELKKDESLLIVSGELKISKGKVLSFINYITDKDKNKEIRSNVLLTELEKKKLKIIENKKRRILREHEIYILPDWAKSLTIEELLNKLKEKDMLS